MQPNFYASLSPGHIPSLGTLESLPVQHERPTHSLRDESRSGLTQSKKKARQTPRSAEAPRVQVQVELEA